MLQRYRYPTNSRMFDGTFGELDRPLSNGDQRWYSNIDLTSVEPDFFKSNEVEQERVIADFFSRAFAYGEALPRSSDTIGTKPTQIGDVNDART